MAKKKAPETKKGVARFQAYADGFANPTDDQSAHLKTILEDEAMANNLGESMLRQDEYDRAHSQLTTDRTAVQADAQKVEEERAGLATWREKNLPVFDTMSKQYEVAQTENAALRNRLQTLKNTHGLTEEDIAMGATQPNGNNNPQGAEAGTQPGVAPNNPAVPPGNPGAVAGTNPSGDNPPFASVDDVHHSINIAAVTQDLAAEHTELFPKERLKVADLVTGATKANKSLRDYWEETYKVPERREAIANETRQTQDASLVAETEQRVRSEFSAQGLSVPGGGVPRRAGSPMLEASRTGAFTPEKDVIPGSKPEERSAEAAVALFESGALTEAANRGFADYGPGDLEKLGNPASGEQRQP